MSALCLHARPFPLCVYFAAGLLPFFPLSMAMPPAARTQWAKPAKSTKAAKWSQLISDGSSVGAAVASSSLPLHVQWPEERTGCRRVDAAAVGRRVQLVDAATAQVAKGGIPSLMDRNAAWKKPLQPLSGFAWFQRLLSKAYYTHAVPQYLDVCLRKAWWESQERPGRPGLPQEVVLQIVAAARHLRCATQRGRRTCLPSFEACADDSLLESDLQSLVEIQMDVPEEPTLEHLQALHDTARLEDELVTLGIRLDGAQRAAVTSGSWLDLPMPNDDAQEDARDDAPQDVAPIDAHVDAQDVETQQLQARHSTLMLTRSGLHAQADALTLTRSCLHAHAYTLMLTRSCSHAMAAVFRTSPLPHARNVARNHT